MCVNYASGNKISWWTTINKNIEEKMTFLPTTGRATSTVDVAVAPNGYSGAMLLDHPSQKVVDTLIRANGNFLDLNKGVTKKLSVDWQKNWMKTLFLDHKRLFGTTRICDLLIPGTHESTAIGKLGLPLNYQAQLFKTVAGLYSKDEWIKHPDHLAKNENNNGVCQTRTITEQLEMGIRWLDARFCEGKYLSSTLQAFSGIRNIPQWTDGKHLDIWTCHAAIGFDSTLKTLLKEIQSFLTTHPHETVFLNMKSERDSAKKAILFALNPTKGMVWEAKAEDDLAKKMYDTIIAVFKTTPTMIGNCLSGDGSHCHVKPTDYIADHLGKLIIVNNMWNSPKKGFAWRSNAAKKTKP